MLKQNEQIILLKKLSKLLSAGVPIEKALTIANFPSFVCDLLKQGFSLSVSCKKIFSQKIVSFLNTGEVVGDITQSINLACRMLSFQQEQRKEINNALFYPFFIFLFSLVSMLVFLIVVVPQIKGMLSSVGVKDFVFFSIIEFFAFISILIFGILILGVIITKFFSQNYYVSFFIEKLILLMPILNINYKKYLLSKFFYELSMLLSAGIPLNTALELLYNSLESITLKKIIFIVKQKVEDGYRFSESLQQSTKFFGDFVIKMCILGEETGDLEFCLKTTGDMFFEDLKDFLKKFSVCIEPVATICVGIFAGVLIFSMLSPITVLIDKIQ